MGNKTIALGTSKLNYLDPRISVAWCKKYDVPIEKVYNKTQREKFRWAIDMAGPDSNSESPRHPWTIRQLCLPLCYALLASSLRIGLKLRRSTVKVSVRGTRGVLSAKSFSLI